MDSSSAKSQITEDEEGDIDCIISSDFFSMGVSRASKITFTPVDAKHFDNSNPMPFEAPVTRYVFCSIGHRMNGSIDTFANQNSNRSI
jgi:hypothetical protein